MAYQRIENYGIIGDLNSVALVGMNGSIDFMCFPNFDSPTIFAALLDDAKGGRFELAPTRRECNQKQLYLPSSNILLSRFLFEDGMAEISDYMPIGHAHDLVRRAKTIRGRISYRMICRPRFDYARVSHRIEFKEKEVLFVPEGNHLPVLRLRSSVPMKAVNGDAVAEFELSSDQSAAFVLEQVRPDEESPSVAQDYVPESFKDTLNFWRCWIGRSQYRGRWREAVDRSALLLKLLTYAPTGTLVAAPTFGLPEVVGGGRNWDYRYTWIRDASFTLYALIRLGLTGEAGPFMNWVQARCSEVGPSGPLQVMYGVDGGHDLKEQILHHLEGYKKSAPVRVGNDAHRQLQLDIYGELLDSIYLYDKYGDPISHGLWQSVVGLLDWVCKNWRQEDTGIWEVRAARRELLYSRVMCWVALDRGLRLARKRSFPAPFDTWLRERDDIYRDVFENFWSQERQAFMQYKHGNTLDASALLMPLVRFISPKDPRWLSTLSAIEKHLVYDSLVYRYRIGEGLGDDGLPGEEGTFNMCTFWYTECLSRAGHAQKARFYFEKMLGYGNHLGLFSEELGYRGEHLGNFPQAFTHLALISAAYEIDRRLSASEATKITPWSTR